MIDGNHRVTILKEKGVVKFLKMNVHLLDIKFTDKDACLRASLSANSIGEQRVTQNVIDSIVACRNLQKVFRDGPWKDAVEKRYGKDTAVAKRKLSKDNFDISAFVDHIGPELAHDMKVPR
jgi:hypothetical protein